MFEGKRKQEDGVGGEKKKTETRRKEVGSKGPLSHVPSFWLYQDCFQKGVKCGFNPACCLVLWIILMNVVGEPPEHHSER